jgi:ABC-type branched-subunit amino acid transport system ATPase component/predicted MFS family arabinose efflux permease
MTTNAELSAPPTPGLVERALNRMFGRSTRGEGAVPLGILSAIYFFDEFDTAAFGTLAPDIQRDFGLDDSQFLGLVVLNVTVTALLAIPLGYLGDRFNRPRLVIASGIISGIFSMLTGLAGTVLVLALARFGNGIGLLANGTVHRSLLSDYYSEAVRPAAYANHTNALYLGAIAGPLFAGTVGALFGWRATFVLLIVPILVVTWWARRLDEPLRGGSDDATAAAAAAGLAAPGMRDALRLIRRVRTLRCQYLGAILFGAGYIPIAIYFPLFYEREFGLGPFERGLLEALRGLATFLALLQSGSVAARWFARGPAVPLRGAGLALIAFAGSLLATVLAPSLWVAVPVSLAGAYAVGFFFAPFYSIQALVTPARVRTLSFSLLGVFVVLGAVVLFLSGFGSLSDEYGIRVGLGLITPLVAGSGAVLWYSGRYAGDDAAAALRELQTAALTRAAVDEAGERTDAEVLLACSGVDASYGQVQVLFDVDLQIRRGEILALLGTNGAGKSTLLRVISGLLPPDRGSVWFDGEDITGISPQRAVALGIVQMPGGKSVFPTLTVAESLRLAGWMYKRSDPDHVRTATAQVLEYFPLLEQRRDQLAGNLSGGEQQMLGLAMTFIAKPRLLIIDELSLGLAPVVVGQLVDIVRRINAQGTTVVLVEQSVNVALTLAERAVFMEKGEVRFSGRAADLLERDDLLRSVFLKGSASQDTERAPATTRERRERPAGTEPLLAVRGLVKGFGGIRATDGVSFDLFPHEIVGVIGPNGAGKTTLFDLVSGYLKPDAGQVTLLGEDVTGAGPEQRALAGLARSFQDARLFPSLTVAENLALAFERHLPVRDVLAAALGLPEVLRLEADLGLTVLELVDLLGLGAYAHKLVGELSTGSRRIVDLGMALAHRPEVLVLDEPSSGIAQREAEALGPLLLRIHAELGCSMLVIEHDMPLLLGISDRLLALETGRLIAEGPPGEVVQDPRVVAAYLDTDEATIKRSGAAAAAVPAQPGAGRGPRPATSRRRRAPATASTTDGSRS